MYHFVPVLKAGRFKRSFILYNRVVLGLKQGLCLYEVISGLFLFIVFEPARMSNVVILEREGVEGANVRRGKKR